MLSTAAAILLLISAIKIGSLYLSRITCAGWMQDIEKWFGRWNVIHLSCFLFSSPHITTHVILYWMAVRGGHIPKFTWKEFESVQKHFLTKLLHLVKKQMTFTLLLPKMGSLPNQIMAMERVIEYMQPFRQLPRITKQKDPKRHKEK